MLITWLTWLLAFFTLLGMATFAMLLLVAIMLIGVFRAEKHARKERELEAEAETLAFKQAVMAEIELLFQEFPKELP